MKITDVLIDDFRPVQYEETSTENHFDHSTIENEIILPSIESTNLISSLQTSQVDKSVNRLGTWKCNDLTTILIISFLANVFTMFSFFCGESELNVGCNMIFLPFIGAKCLEYLLQENREPENNILQLFLMANLRSNHLKRMFMYTQYLTSFTQDLCVYFFFFVCINQLFRIFAIL